MTGQMNSRETAVSSIAFERGFLFHLLQKL